MVFAALRCAPRAAAGRSSPFEARLVRVGSKAVVSGKDFDPDTGELKEKLDASSLVSALPRRLVWLTSDDWGDVLILSFGCFTHQFIVH